MATSHVKRKRRNVAAQPAARRRHVTPRQGKRAARGEGHAPKRRRVTGAGSPRRADLPGWSELASGKSRPVPDQPDGSGFLEAISTVQFAGLILLLAAAFTLYVGHVHATQDLAAQLQQVRRENLRLHLKENRLRGAFEQATGPAVIYERARTLGFEEGMEYGPTIRLSE